MTVIKSLQISDESRAMTLLGIGFGMEYITRSVNYKYSSTLEDYQEKNIEMWGLT
jgi:hypothetical protein